MNLEQLKMDLLGQNLQQIHSHRMTHRMSLVTPFFRHDCPLWKDSEWKVSDSGLSSSTTEKGPNHRSQTSHHPQTTPQRHSWVSLTMHHTFALEKIQEKQRERETHIIHHIIFQPRTILIRRPLRQTLLNNLQQPLPPEGLVQCTTFVMPCEQEVEECNYGTFKPWPVLTVVGEKPSNETHRCWWQ